jgi:hypothetical protein
MSSTSMFSATNQQAIVDAFNSQTYISDQVDVQHTPIYDTVTIAAGGSLSALTSAFFQNVGPQSGKTLALTNMNQPGRLQAPEAFSIFSFRLRISENILPADLVTIMNGFAMQFIIGQKAYNLAPLWHYNAGGGIFSSATALAGGVSTGFAGNGVPARTHMHKLAIPIVIENQANFSASLQGTAVTLTASGSGGTGATIQLLLDGLYARGVQ